MVRPPASSLCCRWYFRWCLKFFFYNIFLVWFEMNRLTLLNWCITVLLLLFLNSVSRHKHFSASDGGAQPWHVGFETSASSSKGGADLQRERSVTKVPAAGEQKRPRESSARCGCESKERWCWKWQRPVCCSSRSHTYGGAIDRRLRGLKCSQWTPHTKESSLREKQSKVCCVSFCSRCLSDLMCVSQLWELRRGQISRDYEREFSTPKAGPQRGQCNRDSQTSQHVQVLSCFSSSLKTRLFAFLKENLAVTCSCRMLTGRTTGRSSPKHRSHPGNRWRC